MAIIYPIFDEIDSPPGGGRRLSSYHIIVTSSVWGRYSTAPFEIFLTRGGTVRRRQPLERTKNWTNSTRTRWVSGGFPLRTL